MGCEYNNQGREVLDHVVNCYIPVTINSVQYYVGLVGEWVQDQVVDNGQSNYGAWTAASKGGARLTIYKDALPANSYQLKWNLDAGKIYSTTPMTVYLRYLSNGQVLGQPREYTIDINQLLPNANKIMFCKPCPWVFDIGEYSIFIGGNRPNAQLNLTLYKTNDATGTSTTLTLAAGTSTSQAWQTITNGFKIQPNEYITIYSAAANFPFSEVKITLRERIILEEQ